jgi:hypothetical protein
MLDAQDLCWWRLGESGALSQEGTSSSDAYGTIAVGKQTVAADFYEAEGQDVQTKAAEELLQRQGHLPDPTFVSIVLIAEGDGTLLTIQDRQSVIGDGDPVSVANMIPTAYPLICCAGNMLRGFSNEAIGRAADNPMAT